MIKFFPGLAGAAVAFVVVRLATLVTAGSIALEFLIFVCTYLIVTVLLEQAMIRYGTRDEG